MSSNSNPTTGQKVTPTPAPVTTPHSHGQIDPSSLAASSLRSDGAFASNTGASPGDTPAVNPHANPPNSRNAAKSGAQSQSSYGGAAPTYVNSQFLTYEGGPKGKNLTEGGFAGSGTSGGRMPEPGSKGDPGRAALEGFTGSSVEEGTKKRKVDDGEGELGKGDNEFRVLKDEEA